jgi:fatty acid-binding protein DegV
VKPVLSIKNGVVVAVEQPRTRSKAYGRIAQMLREMEKPEQFTIVESDSEVGQQLAQAVKQTFPESGAIPTYKLGAVVGTYAGPGTAGIAFVIPPSG